MTMTMKLVLSVCALSCVGLVACGDDDESGSGGATSSTTASTTSATSGSGGSGGEATTSTTSGTGGAGGGAVDCSAEADTAACRSCCAGEHPEGTLMLQSLVAKGCGCDAAGPCATDCSAEAFCAETNGVPTDGSACETCINSLGTTESCALAQVGTCQADEQCAASLGCILSCP